MFLPQFLSTDETTQSLARIELILYGAVFWICDQDHADNTVNVLVISRQCLHSTKLCSSLCLLVSRLGDVKEVGRAQACGLS